MKPQRQGARRIVHATGYSLRGLGLAWRRESAFRQELALCLVMLPAAVWLGRDGVEVALLGGVCLLVLVVELLNSAIEAAIDRIGAEPHPLAGIAKDVGSAAVFVSLLLAVFVWGCLLIGRIGG